MDFQHRSTAPSTRVLDRLRGLLDPGAPWVWLIYIPLYGLPWLWNGVTSVQLSLSAVAIALFLTFYVASHRASTPVVVGCAIGVFVISLLAAPLGGLWTIITIYAAAIAGKLHSARHAATLIAMFCLTACGVGIMAGLPLIWWLPGLLLAIMVGGANVSRAVLDDKNQALIAAQEQVRELSQVAERERITRDLHDLIGRTLTLIAVKADLAARLLEIDPRVAGDEIADIAKIARESLVDVRRALSGTGNIGLAREIESSREALAAAGVDLTVEGDPAEVPVSEGLVLAMAMREAVTNVVRHSAAQSCRIRIVGGRDHAWLRVSDDGRGGHSPEGSGLTGMRERLRTAGGTLVREAPATGTSLLATLPVGAR